MRPIYVIKDSNSLHTKHESNLNLNQAGNVELNGKLVNAHKTRAYATSSMSVSSPTSLLNVSDLSNLSSPFYLTTGQQQQQTTTAVKGTRTNVGGSTRSASVTTTAPGPTPVAGSSSLHHSNSGRSTSSSMNASSTSSFVYSSATLASSTTGTSKNVSVAVTAAAANPMSSSSICLNNMVHGSYQPSTLNNAGSNAGGSLSNLSSYSCNSTPSSSSPPFYLIALPTKTVTGDVNDMNNNYKANVMLDTNSSLLINQSYTKSRTVMATSNDAIDTTSLFSPSKISKLQKSNQNLNDRFNYQSQITNLLGQSGAPSLMNSGDYWKEFILDASNYESSLSHYNPPNNNYNDTPLQTPSTAPVPTRSPFEDINNNNEKPSSGEKATPTKAAKGSASASTSSSTATSLTTSKVRSTTTIMSSTVASSSSAAPVAEIEADDQQQASAPAAVDAESVAAAAAKTPSPTAVAAPPVPSSSPPASPAKSPSKSPARQIISSSSSKTATPVHVSSFTSTTTTTTTGNVGEKDRRLVNDSNKLVASYPISYTSTLTSVNTSPYKSTISARPTVISRRMDRSQAVTTYASNAGGSSINSYAIAMRPAAQSAAGIALKETRENERKQLSELNDRFAGYVERVRFLEAQNKKLQIELDMLKSKWGQETKHIEKMYQVELEEARSVLNDTSKTKDGLQVKLDRSEQELNEMKKRYYELENQLVRDKEKIATLQDQIAANESEIGLIRRRLNDLQDEEKRYKLEAQRMMNEIQRVSYELECEVKQRLSLENDKQSLEEELVFLKEVHSKEIEELKHLSFKDSGIDPSNFFKSELSTAIKEIREEYENLNQSQRNELEGWYRMKVEKAISEIQRKNAQAIGNARTNESEFSREQAKKMRAQITDSKKNITDLKAKNAELESRIRDLEDEIKREESDSSQLISHKEHEIQILKEELNRIVAEYDDLMATKSDLEVEIRTYRKLLEGEENRDGLRQIVETIEHRARAITAGPASGYSSDRDSSPLCRSGIVSKLISKPESSPRRFGGFLPMSRSHDDSIEKLARGKKKTCESPFRRSILESNEADDSSAAEDNDERHVAAAADRPGSPSADAAASAGTTASAAAPEKDYGQILVSIQYDSVRSKLLVKIVQASKLINTDKDSLSDPYARIILLPDRKKRTKRKTKIIKDSLTPQWDEQFEYDLSLADAKSKTIDLVVKNDKSLFSREKTFMGKCLIPLESIDSLELGSAEWYKLQEESAFEAAMKKINEAASSAAKA